jgi:hypothetical protein
MDWGCSAPNRKAYVLRSSSKVSDFFFSHNNHTKNLKLLSLFNVIFLDLNKDLYSVNAALRLTSELKLMATSNSTSLPCALFSRNWTCDQKCCVLFNVTEDVFPHISTVRCGWRVAIRTESYGSEPYAWCIWQPWPCFDWLRVEPHLWDLCNFQWSIAHYFEIYISSTYYLKIEIQPVFWGITIYVNIKNIERSIILYWTPALIFLILHRYGLYYYCKLI